MAVTVPSFIPEPFANEGQKATIPDTPSSEQGRASWQLGFPQVCAQPLASGGIPPNYLDFQGIFNALSSSICYMQTGALWPWSSTLTYPKGAHVLGDDGKEYTAVQESTGKSPTTGGTTYWQRTDAWRLSMIGSLVPMAVSTLPGGFGKPDGSLFLFEDYPELKEKYDAGGFNGMLLESTATSEEKDAWRGKWIKHPQGLGLYAPRLQGLFLRNAGILGKYNEPGIPDAPGYIDFLDASGVPIRSGNGVGALSSSPITESQYSMVSQYSTSAVLHGVDLSLASANPIYGKNSTVMPASADMNVGLYLGSHT